LDATHDIQIIWRLEDVIWRLEDGSLKLETNIKWTFSFSSLFFILFF